MSRAIRTAPFVVAALVSTAMSLPAQNDVVDRWLAELTLEEKATLVTGRNAWETAAVERLGIPAVWLADGPVGVRRSLGTDLGLESHPATLFPSAAAMAATWNPSLIERVGAAIGAEAQEQGVALLLGPGLNLKRHPLGGRNFEYYSEDPLLAGTVAAAFVRGVQSQGVGATLKHFAVNNQETRRMTIDARVDERPLRELYLRGFEIAVREAGPAAVMSAYNRVNGIFASEHRRLLTDILRDEWGFEGLVVSDWGAVDDPVASLVAGLDLEMPGNPTTPARVVRAVEEGRLDEAALDRAVAAVLRLAAARTEAAGERTAAAPEDPHALAREVAIEGTVLLQNDGVLPLDPRRRIGVVGRFAVAPRLQGIGSSQVSARLPETPWQELQRLGEQRGAALALWAGEVGEEGLDDAERVELARFLAEVDVVVVFAGQPAAHDAEAWDRPSAELAPTDLDTLDVVRTAAKPFAVVVTAGGAVDVSPFADDAGAVLLGWLGGEAWGSAVAQLLFGKRSPSGKLSETFAHRVSDHPSALHFPGGPREVRYGEGLYVGYRYFQSFDHEVAYPFGHGLSYTSFELSGAAVPGEIETPGVVPVTVEVHNTGERRGAETVQVYARQLEPSLPRPAIELVAFAKVELEPGERRRIEIAVPTERLAYWHDAHGRRVTEAGDYRLLVGVSAADLRAELPLRLLGGDLPAPVFTVDDTIGDLWRDPQGRAVIDFLLGRLGRPTLSEAAEDDFFAAVFRNLPFKKLSMFAPQQLPMEALAGLIGLVNSDLPPEQVTRMLEQMAGAGPPP